MSLSRGFGCKTGKDCDEKKQGLFNNALFAAEGIPGQVAGLLVGSAAMAVVGGSGTR